MLSFILGFGLCYLLGVLAIGTGTVVNAAANGMPIEKDEYGELLKYAFSWPLLTFLQ